jgi:hypothetical protein
MGYGLLRGRINFWFEAHFAELIYTVKKKWRGWNLLSFFAYYSSIFE